MTEIKRMKDNRDTVAEFDFDRLSDLFVEARSFTPPSQLHGLLCGQLSAGSRPAQSEWLSTACGQMGVSDDIPPSPKAGLVAFYDEVVAELASEELRFCVLLPEDEGLARRAEALGQWCAGFVSGFGMAGLKQADMSEEAIGVLTDLAQIAQIEVEEQELGEAGEKDFFEVCEYVRLGALMLFAEHGRPGSAAEQGHHQQQNTSIH